jgi:hypothetical protein
MADYGLIKLPTHGGGFFSNYFCMLAMTMTCDQRNLKPYIDLSNTAFVEHYNPYKDPPPVNPENPWDWWFEQDHPTESDTIIPIEFNLQPFNQDKDIWKRPDLPFARSIAKKYFHVRPHILKRVDDHYEELLKGKVTLGVMARGCEMNTYHSEFGVFTIESWLNQIPEILALHPEINSIFLVTEDSHFIPDFVDKFLNTVYLKDVFRRTTETLSQMVNIPLWPCFSSARENHCRLLGEECLIQAMLLGRCDYMLIRQCGTALGASLYATESLKDVIYVK